MPNLIITYFPYINNTGKDLILEKHDFLLGRARRGARI